MPGRFKVFGWLVRGHSQRGKVTRLVVQDSDGEAKVNQRSVAQVSQFVNNQGFEQRGYANSTGIQTEDGETGGENQVPGRRDMGDLL